MTLLRRELGEVLREHRESQGRTLRQLAADSAVSHGYLSEIERGKKEASSELLVAVCDALGLTMSGVLAELSSRYARIESIAAPVPLPLPGASQVSASAA